MIAGKPPFRLLALLVLGLAPLGFLFAQAQPSAYRATLVVSGGSFAQSGRIYRSEEPDTSGIVAAGRAKVQISDPRVRLSGSATDEELSRLWGTGAGVLAAGGASLTVIGGSIRTTGVGSAAVFAVGAESRIVLSEVTAATAALGSPALAVGRGAAVQAARSVLLAEGSEAAAIEGRNTLTLADTALVGGRDGVVFRRSPLEPAPSGPGTLTATGGSITALDGPLFHAAGNTAVVNVRLTTVVPHAGALVVTDSAFTLNADTQTLTGDVRLERGGSLSLNLKNGSSWTGSADSVEAASAISVVLDATSTWTVTADSRIGALTLARVDPSGLAAALATGGHTIAYQSSANPWLGGRTVALTDGGRLVPY